LVPGERWRGADVGELRTAGDIAGEPDSAVARPVVGDDDHRDDLPRLGAGAVLQQREAEQVLHHAPGVLQGADGLSPGLGGGDRAAERELGDVVNDTRHLPGPAAAGLQLGEVGLPHAVASGGRRYEGSLACLGELPPFALIADGL